MREAVASDADLLMEVQSFWIEPVSYVPLWSKGQISWLAEAVVEWLQVRQTPLCSSGLFNVILNDRLAFRSLMTHQRR